MGRKHWMPKEYRKFGGKRFRLVGDYPTRRFLSRDLSDAISGMPQSNYRIVKTKDPRYPWSLYVRVR